jgi:hypothetical protein
VKEDLSDSELREKLAAWRIEAQLPTHSNSIVSDANKKLHEEADCIRRERKEKKTAK